MGGWKKKEQQLNAELKLNVNLYGSCSSELEIHY